jgi:hypothetical protein
MNSIYERHEMTVLKEVRSNHGINVFFVYVLTQDSSLETSRVAIVADSECTRFVIRMCAARSLARQIARADESYKVGLIDIGDQNESSGWASAVRACISNSTRKARYTRPH